MRRLTCVVWLAQSFGEVTQIMRMPNGDLHVHFRKAEVAETVGVSICFVKITTDGRSTGVSRTRHG